MTETLQQKMFHELESRDIFETAKKSAFDYADTAFDRHVYPKDDDIAALRAFVERLPRQTGDADAIVKQLHRLGSPATVATIAGRYFGFVTGGAVPAALAARWLADFWDQNAALYKMSPVNSVLQEVCKAWLRDLFSLPPGTVAGYVSGSSGAILCGLAAGRYRVFRNNGWDINRRGFLGAPRIRVVTGAHTHATVLKAAALLGFGTDNVEMVDVDGEGRIIADRVPELDRDTILVLQAGNVNSGSFDPIDELCDRANAAGAWVHVDGAFGLWAACSKRLAHLCKGIEKADSWSIDGHKTLNTPYDNGVVMCRDRDALVTALQAAGSYIVQGDGRDGMFFTPDMSRRAQAVELWATLKYLGRDGIDELVTSLHDHAVAIAGQLRRQGFDILNDVVFNQVLVGCDDQHRLDRMTAHMQASGDCWVGGASWFGRPVIRISVCSWATTGDDVARTVEAFVRARDEVDSTRTTAAGLKSA